MFLVQECHLHHVRPWWLGGLVWNGERWLRKATGFGRKWGLVGNLYPSSAFPGWPVSPTGQFTSFGIYTFSRFGGLWLSVERLRQFSYVCCILFSCSFKNQWNNLLVCYYVPIRGCWLISFFFVVLICFPTCWMM